MARNTSRVYTPADGLIARAGRAHEDPKEMTRDAYIGRLAKHVTALLRENPELTDLEIAKAARLRLRAEMARASRKSAEVRRQRKAGGTGPVHMAELHKYNQSYTLWCGAHFEGRDEKHIDTRWTENAQDVTCTECLALVAKAEAADRVPGDSNATGE